MASGVANQGWGYLVIKKRGFVVTEEDDTVVGVLRGLLLWGRKKASRRGYLRVGNRFASHIIIIDLLKNPMQQRSRKTQRRDVP